MYNVNSLPLISFQQSFQNRKKLNFNLHAEVHMGLFIKRLYKRYDMIKLTLKLISTPFKVERFRGQTCLLKNLSIARQARDTILISVKLVELRIKVFQRYSNEVWATLPPERKCLISKRSSSRGRTQQLGRATKY